MEQGLKSRTEWMAFRGLVMSKGYKSKELAEEIGMEESMLSDRIRGRTRWLWKDVLAVCKVLDIKLEEFARYYPA